MRNVSSDELVDALYVGLLGREPDEAGRRAWVNRVAAGTTSVEAMIRAFVDSTEFGERMSRPRRFTNDVSQYGETLELLRLWVADHQSAGVAVDVGARGVERSNSYDLMKHFGWRGLLIEANPALIPQIAQDFAGLAFDLVNCAVSDYEGRATLSLGVNEDISSLNVEATKAWGELRGGVEVEVRRLEGILSDHEIPEDFDLLSLDIEGEDIKVLNGLLANSRYRPRWIIIEASHDYSVRKLEDLPFSEDVRQAYEIRGQTRANLILGRRSAPA